MSAGTKDLLLHNFCLNKYTRFWSYQKFEQMTIFHWKGKVKQTNFFGCKEVKNSLHNFTVSWAFKWFSRPISSKANKTIALFANTESAVVVDWNNYVLCQAITSEPLQCPADSKRKDLGAGYKSLGNNLRRFQELACLPFKVGILSLDKDERPTQIFKEKSAKWHKSCRDKFSNLKWFVVAC